MSGKKQSQMTVTRPTVAHDRDWTWIYFPGKPDEDVREALKSQFGARFSGKRVAWYIQSHVEETALRPIIGA